MKQGQVIGQALLFVLGAIIFSMILIYGYNAISKLQAVKSEVCLIDMENTLKNQVERVRASFGSVRKLDLSVCPGYTSICFIDTQDLLSQTTGNQKALEPLYNISARMADAVASGADQNVFLKPLSETPINIGTIDIDPPEFLCFEKIESSTISLRLEGLGDRTKISRWNLL
ncbi:MAG: hypothetical protein AABX52_03570 [Nanoarchaeota archaeon]